MGRNIPHKLNAASSIFSNSLVLFDPVSSSFLQYPFSIAARKENLAKDRIPVGIGIDYLLLFLTETTISLNTQKSFSILKEFQTGTTPKVMLFCLSRWFG